MDLRIATAADLAQIEALVHAAYSPWVDTIGAVPGPMHDDYARAIAQGFVQVLEHQDAIAALLVLVPLPDAMLLDNVAVRPSSQGLGLGRRLMQAAETAARAEGYNRVHLYTHEKMAQNITLYQRQGYQITHHVTERGLNRVYMEKRLLPHDA